MTVEPTENTTPVQPGEVEQLVGDDDGGEAIDYVEQVVTLYEATERNYRAAMMSGHVVNGFTDSTNY